MNTTIVKHANHKAIVDVKNPSTAANKKRTGWTGRWTGINLCIRNLTKQNIHVWFWYTIMEILANLTELMHWAVILLIWLMGEDWSSFGNIHVQLKWSLKQPGLFW